MKKQLVHLAHLAHLAHARSGDKGDKADLSLFAPDQQTYELLAREVTAERVKQHFQGIITGTVERFEVPNLLALKFVLHGALNGGASRSLRSDALGKSLSSALLRMDIEVWVDIIGSFLTPGCAGSGRGLPLQFPVYTPLLAPEAETRTSRRVPVGTPFLSPGHLPDRLPVLQ